MTFSTMLSALLLPPLGAFIDRSGNKKGLLAAFAWTGAGFASLLFFCKGDNWQIGAIAAIGANLCIAGSLVVNDSILPDISLESERDRVSSRGWAFGYLGSGILLILNLVVFVVPRLVRHEPRDWPCDSACCRPPSGGRDSR